MRKKTASPKTAMSTANKRLHRSSHLKAAARARQLHGGDDNDRPCAGGSLDRAAPTKCFEDPSLVDEREDFEPCRSNGITEALPIVIGFAQWRLPSGGTTPVFIVSSHTRVGGLRPWNLVEGSLADLVPGAVAIDQSYFDRLGTKGLGASAEIRDQRSK